MNKFRASYSILSAWTSGNYEQAVRMYFKMDTFQNEAMEQGKKYHEQWSEETIKTNALPKIFGAKKLIKPQTEIKLTADIYDWLEMVGVIDCLDEPTFYEYKTGVVDSVRYADSHQIGMYGLLLTYNDYFVDNCEIYHYNQHKGVIDVSKVYVTDKLIQDSLNYIVTASGEMHEYLMSNNLYEKLKK